MELEAVSTGDDLMRVMEDLGSAEFRMDPYPYYHRLNEQARAWNAGDRWLFTTHAACDAVLRDRRWERLEELMCLPDRAVCEITDDQSAAHTRPQQAFVLDVDVAPDRARLRQLFADAFSPRRVRQLQPRLEQITDQLLDVVLEAGSVDFMDAFALRLPIVLVCEQLGVPPDDQDLLRSWSYVMVRAADPLFTMSPDEVAERDRVGREFADYFGRLIADRRRRPRGDLLSRLASGEASGVRFTDQELLAACIMLLVAGHEMVSNLLGLGTLALLRNPDEMARLAGQPGLVSDAVEELLRYDSPAQITPRTALEDLVIGGHGVGRGQYAVLLLGAANRDPRIYPDPDRLDVSRRPAGHLAFGQGHLYCPGAPMARAQARQAFGALVRRAPGLRLDGEPERKGTFCIRGLGSLPVATR
jgi:cytochrome P450